MSREPKPPEDIRKRTGERFLWFAEDDRYIPLIDEGDDTLIDEQCYKTAAEMTARLRARRAAREADHPSDPLD
jgi:hypothetical protein